MFKHQTNVTLVLVTNRLGRVGVNSVLDNVTEFPVFIKLIMNVRINRSSPDRPADDHWNQGSDSNQDQRWEEVDNDVGDLELVLAQD